MEDLTFNNCPFVEFDGVFGKWVQTKLDGTTQYKMNDGRFLDFGEDLRLVNADEADTRVLKPSRTGISAHGLSTQAP